MRSSESNRPSVTLRGAKSDRRLGVESGRRQFLPSDDDGNGAQFPGLFNGLAERNCFQVDFRNHHVDGFLGSGPARQYGGDLTLFHKARLGERAGNGAQSAEAADLKSPIE